MIGLSAKTIHNGQCGTDELPRVKLGGRVLFSLKAVEAWMARRLRRAEQEKYAHKNTIADIFADKPARQRAVRNTLSTFINGGRYEKDARRK